MTALSRSTERFGFGEIVGAPTVLWPPGLCVRPRQIQDDDGLCELFAQADFQRNASTLDPFERPDDARVLLERTGPGVFEMVAVYEHLPSRVIGFAGLYAFAGRQRHVGSCTLAVHEGCQQQGVGTALLQALLRSAYEYVGLERLQLTVFTDNVRALSLYQRAGFRIEGRLRSFARREDGFVDAFLLAHHGCYRD